MLNRSIVNSSVPDINDAPKPKDHLSDFNQDRRVLLLSGMAVIIGGISVITAYLLVNLINLVTNVSFYGHASFADCIPAGNALGAWVILVPVAGGLVIGLMAKFGSEKIRGHGIPEALEAILLGRSRMDLKVALLKPLSSAISIGTGGPFGAEGPIIMTGGAMGSLLAQLFHLTSAERKILLVAGAAAGMSAIFGTPLAATLLAIELLLFEWRPRSFIPVAMAATVAGVLRSSLMGNQPIFPVPPHSHLGAIFIGCAFLMGIVSGLGSMALTSIVYVFEDLFNKLKIHWMWWPMMGGLLVGIGGWIDPRAMGVGYASIHGLLLGKDLGGGLLLFFVIKALIWSVALGSGTSGGVLAPLLILGGILGTLEGNLLPLHDPALWAMVGMASMMGGTMRSPLTAIIFTLELTHDISALPALLVSCAAAHAVTVLFLRRSILTEKLARRGHHLAREYSVDTLQLTRVGEVMDPMIMTISSSITVGELSARISEGHVDVMRHHGFPLVDCKGLLCGVATRGDIVRALSKPGGTDITVLEAGNPKPVTVTPEATLDEAASLMLRHGIGRLLVVHRDDSVRLLGYLGRSAILTARLRYLEEESVREGKLFAPPLSPNSGRNLMSGL